MMLIIYVIGFIWCARIVANILSFCYLWYIKEYRFDRMLIHIKTEGLHILFAPPIRRPPMRPKAMVLVAGSLIVLFLFYLSLPFYPLLSIFIIDVFSFVTTGIVVFLLKLPTALYHAVIIFLATQKFRSHAPMIVVGVTGSIGKSSTKEYLTTILSTKYKVLKTPESKNALIGVAETIQKDLQSDHEIFVVEMAAYKKGEIASIARLVRPTVGIVTTINEQHLDLFGSLENTMNAKYELIDHLEKPAIAVFNADNEYTQEMAERASKAGKEIWMFTSQNNILSISRKTFRAIHIKSDLEGLTITIQLDKNKGTITVPVLGEHQVGSILAAIAGAVASGMSFDDAIAGAGLLRSFRKTMQPISGVNGSLFIDDTFNNNPQAAIAAIQFLTHAKGKKILVFQPMIELGSYSGQAHKEVGELAEKICDDIILTNGTYSQFFKQGIQSSGFRGQVHIFSAKAAADFISSRVKKDDIVLFKGKEAGRALGLLTNT